MYTINQSCHTFINFIKVNIRICHQNLRLINLITFTQQFNILMLNCWVYSILILFSKMCWTWIRFFVIKIYYDPEKKSKSHSFQNQLLPSRSTSSPLTIRQREKIEIAFISKSTPPDQINIVSPHNKRTDDSIDFLRRPWLTNYYERPNKNKEAIKKPTLRKLAPTEANFHRRPSISSIRNRPNHNTTERSNDHFNSPY